MNKKEAKLKYKQTIPLMGVYQIKNLKNGRIFIGGAKNLAGKINSHKFQLKNGLHNNKALQKDYDEQGEAGFLFEILDYLSPKKDVVCDYTEELKLLEKLWLEKLQPFDDKGYNKPNIR